MYAAKLGLENAVERIKQLKREEFEAEALVTSVFTLEKLLRRTMRYAIKARGFNNTQAEKLLGRGFDQLKNQWEIFDPQHRRLTSLLTQPEWKQLMEAVQMRNALTHGVQIFSVGKCKKNTNHVLRVIEKLHEEIIDSFGRDTWKIQPARTLPRLSWHYEL